MQNGFPYEACYGCGKMTPDDEWVCNWCYCAECFDKMLEKFPPALFPLGDEFNPV